MNHLHRMVDDFSPYDNQVVSIYKPIFQKGNYINVYGLIHYIVALQGCPVHLKEGLEQVLEVCRSPYRVVGGDALVPLASEVEAGQLEAALALAQQSPPFAGAYSHLKSAASALGEGKNADSIRESIHAVESAARQISGTRELGTALAQLESRLGMHPAMKRAFGSLYGYTSEEKGIRHPLLDEGDARVDETDAIFMLGACAAFVSYLIGKAKAAGIA